jgi:hypothetical protein
VFQGTIYQALPSYEEAPGAVLNVEANGGLIDAVAPTKPISFAGAADIPTVMSGIATQMGLSLENSGVTGQLHNPYFDGSLWEQAKAVAAHGRFKVYKDEAAGRLAIWPKGSARAPTTTVPLLSPQTGMINYPAASIWGLIVRTVYNPSIVFGGNVQVQSNLGARVSGTWQVYGMRHILESQLPRGKWETVVETAKLGGPSPISQPP